jgi:hypothetical protein
MTLIDIMKQAQALSPHERKELVKMLVDSLEVGTPVSNQSDGHWGKNMVRLAKEIGPIELIYPEIDDPVEWVKQIRKDQHQKRLGIWDEEE